MLALFEVLSLEGWLEVRDVIKGQAGPVSFVTRGYMYVCANISMSFFVLAVTRHLHPPVRLHRLHDRTHALRRRRHRQLHGEQRCVINTAFSLHHLHTIQFVVFV